MTPEDEAFNSIVDHIHLNKNLLLISAHPPSGKSYFTDLIRIPSPLQNKTGNRRAHIDIIFCSKQYLYLCEVKGTSKQAREDILKLRSMRDHYTFEKLSKLISDRLTQLNILLKSCNELVLAIGCNTVDSDLEQDILYIQTKGNKLSLRGYSNSIIISDFNLS